jgi:hypothetical protein
MNEVAQVEGRLRFPITHKGQVVSYLNAGWIDSKGLTPEDVKELQQSHSDLRDVYDMMEATDDVKELRKLAIMVTDIEFKQQLLWKFPMDRTMHNWYKVPKCTCPKMDNMDARGTEYWIVSGDCPIHRDGFPTMCITLDKDYYTVT